MTTFTLKIDGMTCDGCVRSVTNAVSAVAGVQDVQVDLASGVITVQADDTCNQALIAEAIEDAGFDVVG
ncbi:MAG: heavy metal-associated domain-containing protein [Moraxella sp.]|nr:heavy metal-associated domain-containing protein [Moraxella sp.]